MDPVGINVRHPNVNALDTSKEAGRSDSMQASGHDRGVQPDTWARVEAALREVAPTLSGPIRPSDRLVEDLGLDSLALVRAVAALETGLDVELPADRLHELRGGTAGGLADLVAEARAA
jgi:acyl carrier protein